MSNSIFLVPYSNSSIIKKGEKGYSQIRIGEYHMVGGQQKPILMFFNYPSAHDCLIEQLIQNKKSLQDYYQALDPFAKYRKQESIFIRYSTEDQVVGEFGWQFVQDKDKNISLINGNKLVKKYFLSVAEPKTGLSWEDLKKMDQSLITKVAA